MIINQDDGLVVPEKTIAFFPVIADKGVKSFDLNDVSLFLRPLNLDHKREWFSAHFYKCLPLSIGNMQGFVFSLPYGFDVLWKGGASPEDLHISYHKDAEQYENLNFIHPSSEFGHGILTIHYPINLKTPPNTNLMTISAPNFPLPGMSPMTGVVESDNLRFSFTLNLKIDIPNTPIRVLPNYPLVGIIPIPRYFCDSFELKNAYDIFEKEVVDEETKVSREHSDIRAEANANIDSTLPDRLYYRGMDVRGNKFKDHQIPKNNKKV
jgi:hypothetical protein